MSSPADQGTTPEETEPLPATGPSTPTRDEYTWADFMREHGYESEVGRVYRDVEEPPDDAFGFLDRFAGDTHTRTVPTGDAWETVEFDPETYLGFHPDRIEDRLAAAATDAGQLLRYLTDWLRATPVVKDEYGWEQFKVEYYYDEYGLPPETEDDSVEPFDPEAYLGFDPDTIERRLEQAAERARHLRELEDERTVDVNPDLDEDAFFSTVEGHTTVTNRYDLEKAVDMEKKTHFAEIERYWVDKPYAFVVIFHSTTENEQKYYLVTPYLNREEDDLKTYLTGKLRTSIKYSDDVVVQGTPQDRAAVIRRELSRLLDRYGLYTDPAETSKTLIERLQQFVGHDESVAATDGGATGELDGIQARPEPAVLDDDAVQLTEYQVEKLEHLLVRDFVGYERIDGIKHDVNVEDISCDGYDSPVFVYHSSYEQLITNVAHERTELDRFVVKLAQRSGKSISKRHPQVDATLPDGSRAQLTLGEEVSDHGTNYTIRQFNDVPFTPIDLVNWHTFSLDEMVYLWLCIENNKSLLFAGGTASGKTTSLNAVSLFIPSNSKIVTIEDTREVELPQRNWIDSVTRPAFSNDDEGDIDEFDLLEAALRQRPEYLLMGEVRGEEGRTLFQVMSTGHTTLTTFHADSVGEVLKRFTTDPINVSKTMFTALDLVSVQTQTRVGGQKIRRNKVITEVNHYDTERDEINVTDVHHWRAQDDEFRAIDDSRLLEEIKFDRGWDEETLREQLFKRRVVLAYLIDNGLNEYAEVAATIQAFINDPDTVLALIARDQLTESLADLRQMESVLIDIAPEKEELVPRPDPNPSTLALAESTLADAEAELFEEYRQLTPSPLVEALPTVDEAKDVVATPGSGQQLTTSGEPREEPPTDHLTAGDDQSDATDDSADGPQ